MTNNLVPANAAGDSVVAIGNMPNYMTQYAQQSSMGTFGDGFAGGRRVQLKGGQINFLGEDGKPMGVVANSDGSVTAFPQFVSSANIIIVGIAPDDNTTYRTFYAEQYKDGDTLPPTCWSADGVAPNDKSFAKQSDTCANCPKNVSGTSATGKGKACGSRKKLAVVFAGDPDMRVFSMDLSSTALFGKSNREAEGFYTLSGYAKWLKSVGAIWEGVITEVSFAEGSNIGVRFRALGYATEQQFTNVMTALKQADDTKKALEVDFPERKTDDNAAPAADPKAAVLSNPAFFTTLVHLKDWAANPAVTIDMIKAEAAKYGVAL